MEDARRIVRKSFAIKVQEVAAKAEHGEQVDEELWQLMTNACAHVCSLNMEEPKVAVLQLIGSIKVRCETTPQAWTKARAVFALAIMQAEAYIEGLDRRGHAAAAWS